MRLGTTLGNEATDLALGIEGDEEAECRRPTGSGAMASPPVPGDLERIDGGPTGGGVDPVDEATELYDTDLAAEESSFALHLDPDVPPGRIADGATRVVSPQSSPPVRDG